jgi:FAD/FMN-containing dehydrogenase
MLLYRFPDFPISLVRTATLCYRDTQSLLTGPEISKKELDDLGIFASILGHIGDGNFHSSIMYDRNDPEEKARVEKVVYDMVDRALEMEGSCTV